MMNKTHRPLSVRGRNIAAIDLGSHTARLLIAEREKSKRLFNTLTRKRAYIHLSEDFKDNEKDAIGTGAMNRTLAALEDFSLTARDYGADEILAVSTGVVRKASNRDHFLRLIYDRTGIHVPVISGEEEARLTGMGVLHNQAITGTFVIFDLGGGTTEFIAGGKNDEEYRSVPLGALELTRRFLHSDPPGEESLRALIEHTDRLLKDSLPHEKYLKNTANLIGSGGTITTLAAMANHMDIQDITPEKVNGLTLARNRIEDIFAGMKSLSLPERLKLPGLDPGRAGVILAGTAVVIQILNFFHLNTLKASYSDILEGILISYLEGEENG